MLLTDRELPSHVFGVLAIAPGGEGALPPWDSALALGEMSQRVSAIAPGEMSKGVSTFRLLLLANCWRGSRSSPLADGKTSRRVSGIVR